MFSPRGYANDLIVVYSYRIIGPACEAVLYQLIYVVDAGW